MLSNLYMRRFVLGWKKKRLKAYIVNYADDLVDLLSWRSRTSSGHDAGHDVEAEVETKTRVCSLPEEKFDFLGYTFGRCYSTRTGRTYLGTAPSKKRVQRICRAVSEETERRTTPLDSQTLVGKLNRVMIGWANYFCLGPVSKAHEAVDRHAKKRLRQWLCTKHKVPWPGAKRFPAESLYDVFGLVCLPKRTSSLPRAKS